MRTRGSRRTPAIVVALLTLVAVPAMLVGCSKGSTVAAGADPTSGPAATAAPVVQKTCAEHMAGTDAARQAEVGGTVTSMGLPTAAPDLSTKVDAACQANPDSSMASVVRGLACARTSTTAAAPTTTPASVPGRTRIDPRPQGLTVGHPLRAGGGHGGGRSSGGSSSGGSKSSGGSSSGGSSSGRSSSGGSSSSGHSSSGGSSSSAGSSSNPCG